MTGQARDEEVSIERDSTSSLKEDRVLEVDSAFARQGWRGYSGSLINVCVR